MSVPRILELASRRERRLAPVTTLGRDPGNLIRLHHASVAPCHATVQWVDGAWWLRDLGSPSGTRVGALRVGAEPVRLHEQDTLVFGAGEDAWLVRSTCPPVAFAWCPQPAEDRGEAGGVLFLPAAAGDMPATIFRTDRGTWVIERGEAQVPTFDGDWLVHGGRPWRLVLPDVVGRVAAAGALELQQLTAQLSVSRDWEHVALRLTHGPIELDLGTLQCWSVLLLLADERLRHRDDPDGGWMDVDRICRDLRIRRGTLDVAVTRARQALASCDVIGCERVIVARRGQRRTGLHPGQLVIRHAG